MAHQLGRCDVDVTDVIRRSQIELASPFHAGLLRSAVPQVVAV